MVRQIATNQARAMDFFFDRTAEERCIKNLTVVNDATREAVAIVAERALGGMHSRATGQHKGTTQSDQNRQRQGTL